MFVTWLLSLMIAPMFFKAMNTKKSGGRPLDESDIGVSSHTTQGYAEPNKAERGFKKV